MKLNVMFKPEDLLEYEIKEERDESTVIPGKIYNYKRLYFKNQFLNETVGKSTIHDDIPGLGEYVYCPNPYMPEDCPEKYTEYHAFFWSLPEAIMGIKAGYGDIIASNKGLFSTEMRSKVFILLDRDIAAKKREECLADWGKNNIDLDDIGYTVSVGFGFSSSPIVKILSDEELLKEIKDIFKSEEKYQEKWNSYSEKDKDDFLMERYVRGNSFERQFPVTFKTYAEMQKVRNEFERVYRNSGPAHDYTGSSWELYSQKLIDDINSLRK